MQHGDYRESLEKRIERLGECLVEIRRQMEGLMADNQRLREIVRLAETELRNRREQVQKLEGELHALQNTKLEARAQIEQAIDHIDELIAQHEESPS
ncbi:MAG: hypothetical protein D6703_01905 [Zetaproteobacteria bacterium]|nr:MAG: hypothetical protein D6703_01905 [Zetaproteobacteria bacterium]